MQKLKAANPDLIVLATVLRETIGSISEARKIGYTSDFIGSQGSYIPALPQLGGKAIDGLYNMNEIPTPYRDSPGNSKLLNEWMDIYKARYGSDADIGGLQGWFVMDMFIKTAEKAGPKTALITGGSRGLGLQRAQALARPVRRCCSRRARHPSSRLPLRNSRAKASRLSGLPPMPARTPTWRAWQTTPLHAWAMWTSWSITPVRPGARPLRSTRSRPGTR